MDVTVGSVVAALNQRYSVKMCKHPAEQEESIVFAARRRHDGERWRYLCAAGREIVEG